MEDMIERYDNGTTYPDIYFSIEKFCYYLLSPSFIEKCKKEYEFAIMDDWFDLQYYVKEFSIAIHEYQRRDEEFPNWNTEPLQDLLNKIP